MIYTTIKELEVEKEGLSIFVILERCRTTYEIYKYINRKGRCTISDIAKSTRANLKTIYRHIETLHKKGFITKDFTNEIEKNGAHFQIIANPELSQELKRIDTLIKNF